MAKGDSNRDGDAAGTPQPSVTQQILTSIVQNTDDAVISRDLDGKILTWNKGAERLYGYKMSEAVGKPVSIIVPDDLPPDDRDVVRRIRRGEHVEHYVTTRQRKDGSKVVVDLTVSPLRDKRGRFIGISSIARDITEQSMMLKRQREFISIASHELRTPLTALTGYLALSQGADDPLQANEFTRRAYQAAQRLTKLVEDLLEVARLEEDRVVLDLAPFNPSAIVEESVQELAPVVRQKRLQLRLKDELTGRDLVKVDPVKFHQIVRNLLDNALKYTPSGGRVSVNLTSSGDVVRIRIKDTGIGIDEKNLEKIFDKFFREYTELSVHAGGTGLGLFITKQLVDRMGGTLAIRSRRQQGTAVTLEFPKAKVRKRKTAAKRKK
ncbi:MAG TPA: PAS domain-containing sensor histidine kinase [Patescibacteria group bacterium]|jgi:PAS domain S-box-containing protein